MENGDNELHEHEADEDEVHTIGYQLCSPHLNARTMSAHSYLQMPSGSLLYDNVKWTCPKLVMDIKNPDDVHSLKLMMTFAHHNVLQAKIVTREDSCLVAWTESFTGVLRVYLQQMRSKLGDSTGMVPSGQLQTIVSQWFDGIGNLIICGEYHGDFKLSNTYYRLESQMPVVKFTNFRVKAGKTLIQCQIEDVLAIADALDEICSMVEQWNQARRLPTLDCCLVRDLAKKLREITKENLIFVMKNIKKHMFFWDRNDRAQFYICDLPFAIRNPDFEKDIEASGICNIPWNLDSYCGLLFDMNNFRAQNNKPAYDGTKKTHFCSFCSGMYTHETELPGVKFRRLRVDAVLQHRNPKACFQIACLMPDREKKYMLSKREAKS